jgi:hypothetical protein
MDIRISVALKPELSDKKDITASEVGYLHLYYCDVIMGYSVTFCSESMESTVPVDQLAVEDFAKLEISFRISPTTTLVLQAINTFQYKQFMEAVSLTKEIVDMRLQLNMCLREVFSDGVFANHAIPEDAPFDDLSTTFLATASSTILETIGNDTAAAGAIPGLSSPIAMSSVSSSSSSKVKPQSVAKSCRLNYSCLACVYCDTPGNLEQLNLTVHPFVPVSIDGNVLYFCEPCRSSWFSFRQAAARLELLVLAGEYNEEVCCVCSDSPTELVLCSACPRSYCNSCLTKLLTPKQSADMLTNENWRCLCCAHSEQTFRGFARTLNLSISTQKSEFPLNLQDSAPVINSTIPTQPSGVIKSDVALLASHGKSKRQRRSPLMMSNDGDDDNASCEEGKSKKICSHKKKMENNSFSSKIVSSPPAKKDPKKQKLERALVLPSCPLVKSPLLKAEHNLPPVNTNLDEAFYFSQYVDSLRAGKDEDKTSLESEDFCFLCKDGGELIECDHGQQGKCRTGCCRKVYHEYCLGFEIPEDQKVWMCMRHYCAMCGSEETAYQCEYCPLSCCRHCFVDWNVKNQFTQFAELSKKNNPVKTAAGTARRKGRKHQKKREAAPITCGTCLRMFDRSFKQGLLSKERKSCDVGVLREVAELDLQVDASSAPTPACPRKDSTSPPPPPPLTK